MHEGDNIGSDEGVLPEEVNPPLVPPPSPSPPTAVPEISTDSFRREIPSFRFGKLKFDKCKDGDTKALAAFFRKIGSRTWDEVMKLDGFNYEKMERTKKIEDKLGGTLPADTELRSLRVNEKARIYGYRVGSIFYVVFYARDHDL